MKIRTHFVSNSSSASFVVALDRLSPAELELLMDYQYSPENIDHWNVRVDEKAGLVTGDTSMDNGAFPEWAEKHGFNKIRFENWN